MDKEQLKEFKDEVLASKVGKEMVADKIEEIQNEIILVKKTMRELELSNVSKPDDQKWYLDWVVDEWKEDLKHRESQLKRWKFRALPNTSKTKNSFDVEAIKAIPISAILETEPGFKAPDRETYLCPIHNEKTASAMWYKKDNRIHCFGCDLDEDVIGLYMKMHGVDFPDACRALIQYS